MIYMGYLKSDVGACQTGSVLAVIRRDQSQKAVKTAPRQAISQTLIRILGIDVCFGLADDFAEGYLRVRLQSNLR